MIKEQHCFAKRIFVVRGCGVKTMMVEACHYWMACEKYVSHFALSPGKKMLPETDYEASTKVFELEDGRQLTISSYEVII